MTFSSIVTVACRFVRCCLYGSLVLGALLGPAAFAQENLLTNASFEELDTKAAIPTGWTTWAEPNYAVYTLAAARTGVSCVAITDDDPAVSQGLRSPKVAIEPGKTYEGSAWLIIERLKAGGFALYLEYWIGGSRIANRSVTLSDAADWKQLKIAYPAPAEATHATVLVYGGSVTVGRAYFDDAALVEVAE